MKAFASMSRHASRSVDSLRLGRSDFRVLEVLLHKGPLPVNVIGPKVNLTPGAISVAVERLVRKRLVRRRAQALDRRVRLVELTAKGAVAIAGGFRQHCADMEAASNALTASERRVLIRLLKKLGKAATHCPCDGLGATSKASSRRP